ncbi:hypothetical protein EDD11_004282 [Mortierella claussenii]|nr:hypothetical protein EDD11_004282 [Mortierella claussenii]
MSKYQPLHDLHQLVQLTHSTAGKAIVYSQVHLSLEDQVDEDEAGGWVLSAFTGKTYFEREYRREDLEDLLTTAGDPNWNSFAKRFRKAIVEGYFHIVDTNARECRVIVDNEVHSRTGTRRQANGSGNSSGGAARALETIEIDMHPVNHTSRSEKLGEFMFECARFIQSHGCSLQAKSTGANGFNSGGGTSAAAVAGAAGEASGRGLAFDDLKLERDNLKTENTNLKREIEKLQAQLLKSSNSSHGGLGAANGRPKSKSAQMAMMVQEQFLKKRKGVSALNPRMKKGPLAKGTEFGSDDDEDNDAE